MKQHDIKNKPYKISACNTFPSRSCRYCTRPKEFRSKIGHTDDSITLIIDRCCAFTGDLPEFALMEAYNDQVIRDSWKLIKDYKVAKIYPAYGNSYTII
ncbi:hypothetical protein [Clostridium homopropionicum]|uniref:hypothetical protein n=1 Tax=Clostridium homopropionicum TaxID=36844 RepID=UPI00068ECBE4|nr:hypothetical protein [Clostridium homopropionicum]